MAVRYIGILKGAERGSYISSSTSTLTTEGSVEVAIDLAVYTVGDESAKQAVLRDLESIKGAIESGIYPLAINNL